MNTQTTTTKRKPHYAVKIAERKKAIQSVMELLEISELKYNMVEYETGINLLLNTLSWMQQPRLQTVTDALLTNPQLGYWNWFVNYRQQQEILFINELMAGDFGVLLDTKPEEAKQWLRRNWKRIHEDIAVSEVAVICCGEFIKYKLRLI